jgi:small subunit ribosomal protein S17
MEKTKKPEKKVAKSEKAVGTICKDRDCSVHGKLKLHGRTFKGKVTKKFQRRVVIEFERMVYVKKYERYKRGKTKIHARLPTCLENEIQIGDYIKVQECRPLSKLVHFAVIGKVKEEEKK